MWRATLNFFGPPPWGPGEGSKGQISFISITKSVSKIFMPNFVCVLSNARYKTYQMGVSFCHQDHAPGVWLWGAGDAQGVKKILPWSCDILNQGGDKQNRMQVQFSS